MCLSESNNLVKILVFRSRVCNLRRRDMAEREQAAVVARMEQLYQEYNKLSHFLRGHHDMSEGASNNSSL